MLIMAVVADMVRFVTVFMFQAFVPPVVNVQVPDPIVRVRTPEPVLLNVPIVGFCVEPSKVPVKAPIVIETTVGLYPSVTVPPPEDASKVTVSEAPGTEEPPAPPVVADQCVVALLSHVPVPPTQ
jgi:hypothetical protein